MAKSVLQYWSLAPFEVGGGSSGITFFHLHTSPPIAYSKCLVFAFYTPLFSLSFSLSLSLYLILFFLILSFLLSTFLFIILSFLFSISLSSSFSLSYYKKWPIPGLFLFYFCLFNTVDSKQVNKFSI